MYYFVSDLFQNKQFSFQSHSLGCSWPLQSPGGTEVKESVGFLVEEKLHSRNHQLVVAIAFERQVTKMQRGLLLALLATFSLGFTQKNSEDSVLHGLGYTQTISEDSLPFGLVEKMLRRLLLAPLANRFSLATVPFGSGFTHSKRLRFHLGFTRRSSTNSLYFGSGYIRKSSNDYKLEKQRGLLLAMFATQKIPEESGGLSNAVCRGQRIKLGDTPSNAVESYNAASILNVVVESQEDAVSDIYQTVGFGLTQMSNHNILPFDVGLA